MKPIFLALLTGVVAMSACDSSTPKTASTVPTTFVITTTTLTEDSCEDVVRDAADFLEDLIEELDQTSLDTFTDPDAWPRELQELRQKGIALDERVSVLRCDPAAVQGAAFEAADVDPDGPLSQRLVELLFGAGP